MTMSAYAVNAPSGNDSPAWMTPQILYITSDNNGHGTNSTEPEGFYVGHFVYESDIYGYILIKILPEIYQNDEDEIREQSMTIDETGGWPCTIGIFGTTTDLYNPGTIVLDSSRGYRLLDTQADELEQVHLSSSCTTNSSVYYGLPIALKATDDEPQLSDSGTWVYIRRDDESLGLFGYVVGRTAVEEEHPGNRFAPKARSEHMLLVQLGEEVECDIGLQLKLITKHLSMEEFRAAQENTRRWTKVGSSE
ncbi:Uu.00g128770.m01.CDS01 [Anthostomella pinea]|uniref:Uu.00g128770.m01.CDS01 n=1 Tax=Anthostomella pinea TaxID=933095 RepID=A0AAI8VIB0_9PEZI|nr:Uu.00g128770.m01.CDS01 [Anthostomella pinea]